MYRKIPEDDRPILKKLRQTYKVPIRTPATFRNYKEARQLIVEMFNVDTERRIRKVIRDRPEEVITAVEERFSNLQRRNTYLSCYKIIYSRMPNNSDTNPYVAKLTDIRRDIRALPRDYTKERGLRGKIVRAMEVSQFSEAMDKLLEEKFAEVEASLLRRYGLTVKQFNLRYVRAFSRSAKINEVPPKKPGYYKILVLSRAILAVSLQYKLGRAVLRSARDMKFYNPGNALKTNHISINEGKFRIRSYKTAKLYGDREFDLTKLEKRLIRLLRAFSPEEDIFTSKKGKMLTASAFSQIYAKIWSGLTPAAYRKMAISEVLDHGFENTWTGNDELTARKFYKIFENSDLI